MEVRQEVIEIIDKKLRTPRPNVQLSDRLQDLGVESIDAIDIVFELEEKFDVQIPYNANSTDGVSLGGLETVGDVVHAIEGLIAKKS